MTETSQFFIRHGILFVLGAVFVEQIGLPIPALPWLLAAGALAATGQFSSPAGIAVTVLACLVADGIWFYLGRTRGQKVLGTLCRISLEPDSCVRRTQNMFTRYGWRGIVVAKFVPGLSTVVPPLAGMSGLSTTRFLVIDGLGSLLYGIVFIYLGYFFSSQIQQVEKAVASIGGSALGFVGAAFAAYLAYKFWQRRRLLDELRMTRVTAVELRQMLDSGENVVILDLRSSTELERDPARIADAIHLSLDEIQRDQYQIPPNRDVVVYCSCPNEVTAARVALLLRRKGFERVRPLLGGLDAWREQNYPVNGLASTENETKVTEPI